MPTPGNPTTTAPAPPPPAPPQASTFTSEAGTVTAACTPTDRAELLSWRPARTYTIDQVDPGPAMEATVAFRHGRDIVRMTVTCAAGTPSHTVTRTKEKPPAPGRQRL
jgi:serine/threonine-protein kinase